MERVDLELVEGGPTVKLHLGADSGRDRDSVQAFIAKSRKELNVRADAIRMASVGLPHPTATAPSAKELEIESCFAGEVAARAEKTRYAVSRLADQAASLGTAITDGSSEALHAQLAGALDVVELNLARDLEPAVAAMIEAEQPVVTFVASQRGAASPPSGQSVLSWGASLAASLAIEAVLSSPLFMDQLGILQAVQLAGLLGLGICILGVFGGIAFAQLGRAKALRRMAGLLGAVMTVLAVLVYVVMIGHLRISLHSEVPDAFSAASRSFWSNMHLPLRDISNYPLLLINMACFSWVAYKTGPVLGWLDYAKLKGHLDRQVRAISNLENSASDAVDTNRELAVTDIADVATQASENCKIARALRSEAEGLIRKYQHDVVALSDANIEQQLVFREAIVEVHRAHTPFVRFGTSPASMAASPISLPDALTTVPEALEARSVRLTNAQSGQLRMVEERIRASKSRVAKLAHEIEELQRLSHNQNIHRRMTA